MVVEVFLSDDVVRRRIWVCVVGRARHVAPLAGILRLRVGNIDRDAGAYQVEERRRHIFVDPQTSLAAGLWPDRSRMEPVARFELDPVRHRVAHVARSTRRVDSLAGNDLAGRVNVEPIGIRALARQSVEGAEVSGRGRRIWLPNRSRRGEQCARAFFYVDHAILEADFDADVALVGGTLRRSIKVLASNLLTRGTAGSNKEAGETDDDQA